MSTREQIQRLAAADTVDIPYSTVQAKYSGQLVQIIDRLNASSAKPETKAKPPQKMNWKLACLRAPDPPHITDLQGFLDYLTTNSEVYLKLVVDRFIDYEPIHVIPAHFMAQFEQRAKWITDHRKQEQQAAQAVLPFNGQDEEPASGLQAALEEWCREHPHNHRLATVARVALEQLLESEDND